MKKLGKKEWDIVVSSSTAKRLYKGSRVTTRKRRNVD